MTQSMLRETPHRLRACFHLTVVPMYSSTTLRSVHRSVPAVVFMVHVLRMAYAAVRPDIRGHRAVSLFVRADAALREDIAMFLANASA